jgi:putative redox protein
MAAIKETRAIWKGDMTFEGVGHKGFRVTMDTVPESGGHDEGLGPMELVLVALAGCTAMDVISILKKKRQDVTGFEVVTRGARAKDYPRVYTDIEIEYIVRGHDVDPKAVARAIELSETRYCSVSNMLSQTAKLTTTYRIEEAN